MMAWLHSALELKDVYLSDMGGKHNDWERPVNYESRLVLLESQDPY